MIENRIYNKAIFCVASALLAGTMGLCAQQPGMPAPQQPQQPMGMPATSPGMPQTNGPNTQALDDQEFVRKALEGGAAEVQMGQLAQQKSQSDDVKQFAQKMVDDHTKLDEQMQPVAQHLGISEPKGPSKKDSKLIAKLESLSGPQFDQEYIKAMLKGHKQDLKDFKDEAQMAADPNVKQVAQQGETVVSQHLQLIEQIAQSHNIATGQEKETSSLK
jgi:putative membrane protein